MTTAAKRTPQMRAVEGVLLYSCSFGKTGRVMRACIYKYICIYIHTHMCVCIHMCIHVYIVHYIVV